MRIYYIVRGYDVFSLYMVVRIAFVLPLGLISLREMEFETGRKFLIEKGFGLAGAGGRSIGSEGGREVVHAKAAASDRKQDGDRSDRDWISSSPYLTLDTQL